MSLRARIRRAWRALTGTAAPKRPRGGDKRASWESAETDRLNSAHWSRTDDVSINQHLIQHLTTLRQRATYEARNNPYVGAAIRSQQVSVVGQNGPRLQVMSRNKRWNQAAEAIWSDWARSPDINGRLSLADILNLWVGYLPTAGEFFSQIVRDPTAEGVQVRLLQIDPRRCEHPFTGFHLKQEDGTYVILGVKRTDTGKHVAYSFRDGVEDLGFDYRYRWVPADDVIHGFEAIEAEQVRGFPKLAECLNDIAELRQFDAATLRAARAAAEHTVVLTATGPDVEFVELDEEIEVETGFYSTMPPGYEASQLKPEHPATGYKEFRHERLRSIGMAFQQPLMTVLMDSSAHNYSSARFDGQTGQRTDQCTRRMLERVALERVFWRVIREAQLMGLIGLTPPGARLAWHWEPRPHVDPAKEAKGQRERLEAGLTTHTYECALLGLDYEEDVLDVLVRERDAREARGLEPHVMGPSSEDDVEDDEKPQTEEQAEAA